MKFMPQDVFDVVVLTLIKSGSDKSLGGHDLVKAYLHESYGNMYPGDNLWMQQADGLASEFLGLSSFKTGAAKDVLDGAIAVRKQLDENMKQRGALKKMFGGALFSGNHPGPSVRADVARNNIKQLFAAVGTSLIRS